MIVIINVKECCEILKENGMQTNETHIRAGLECGAYPFGVCIKSDYYKSPVYEIYKPLLMKWIKERESA